MRCIFARIILFRRLPVALSLFGLFYLSVSVAVAASGHNLIIRDNQAAARWDTAYPVGNGRLGALPFGSFPKERILINDETIWHRSPADQRLMPEDSFEHLEVIRELEAAGKYAEADRHFVEHLQDRINPDSYQLFGWLNIDYGNNASLDSTYRTLDLKTGIALSVFELDDGTVIKQEVFASAPDDLIAVQITANRAISLKVSIKDGEVVDGFLQKQGAGTGTDATNYLGRLLMRTEGDMREEGGELHVAGADSVSLYLAVATDFNYANSHQKRTDDWRDDAQSALNMISEKSCDSIKSDAITEHDQYFSRVSVDFGETDSKVRILPTRERLERIRQGHKDPELIEAYFQFGRYLLIASSRPGCLPANLQGLWNPHLRAPWSSDYHLNINLQMNYWPADSTNLSEMHTPLFHLVELFQPTGREMARRMGMEGWCMPHATDVWGHARMMSRRAYWGGSFLSGQWLTLHILDHYRFNCDPAILEKYWDVLTESARFAASWLIPGPGEGELMARPACSPENSFRYRNDEGEYVNAAFSAGNSFDQYMTMQVFSEYLEAAKILDREDDPFVVRVSELLPQVYRPRIGDDGRLMEWRRPFDEPHPGHRHISHILGAYPGNQINLDEDQEMRAAVRKSIETRLRHGGARTGWSRAWTIGIFARLSDADEAYRNLIAILDRSTLDNLWDNHPPFQIDGNFGATAAVAEMLLHSHNDEIKLLPALPEEWQDGHITGLRARGDYTVDIVWRDGSLCHANIAAGDNAMEGPVKVVYGGGFMSVNLIPGESATIRASEIR